MLMQEYSCWSLNVSAQIVNTSLDVLQGLSIGTISFSPFYCVVIDRRILAETIQDFKLHLKMLNTD